MVAELDAARLADALTRLRAALHAVRLPLATPGALAGEGVRAELEGQIGDYLLPRLRQMDAPLLMVVGGSTGAGKSTLVNSLLGEDVSAAGVLRPTTRAPVLACHPEDVRWFADDRVLPGLTRTTGGVPGPGGLALVPTARLPEGLALLDAPDIDSVVEANRALAGQLLAAADAWLFVTTAARYADAVPWDLLGAARERGTALSLVLDRVPPEAADEIAAHLRAMLEERGLGATPVLVVPEATLEAGRLPAAALAPVRGWLDQLAADAQARAGLVRRTLTGALESIPARGATVRAALAEQEAAAAIAARRGGARVRHGARRDRRDHPERGAAARRGARALARRRRHGRHHARARDADRPAARPAPLARDGRARRRGGAAHRGAGRRRRGRARRGGPGGGAGRPRLAGGGARAAAPRRRRAAGRRLARPRRPHGRAGAGLAGRGARARPGRGRRQAHDRAARLARRQRRRADGDDRRVRQHGRPHGRGGRRRGRDLRARAEGARGDLRRPGGARARGAGPRAAADPRARRCSTRSRAASSACSSRSRRGRASSGRWTTRWPMWSAHR